jgi:hypothetical protein
MRQDGNAHYLNLVLDTQIGHNSDTLYPSWGTFTVYGASINVDSNNDGTIDWHDAKIKNDPNSTGVIIPVNDDDDDGDGTPDDQENGPVDGEDDLVPVKLSVFPANTSGTVSLTIPSGSDKIKLFSDSDMSDSLTTTTWQVDQMPSTIYAEGVDGSDSSGDIELALAVQPSGTTQPATDQAKATTISASLQLTTTGTIPTAPENDAYNAEKAAAGTDQLGALPMGQGRADMPGVAYVAPLVMVGTVNDAARTAGIKLRWQRTAQARYWSIQKSVDSSKWIVLEQAKTGFPNPVDDTDSGKYNDPTPSATDKVYMYDNPGDRMSDYAFENVGDFSRAEISFVYQLQAQIGGVWKTIAQTTVGQVVVAQRKDFTGVVGNDWNGIENSVQIRTLNLQITEADVRALVGGNLPIQIDPNANK